MRAWQIHLAHQLDELRLIQCSLLPGERFVFVLPPEDLAIWTSLLDYLTDSVGLAGDDPIASLTQPPCQARFEMHTVGARIWFEVELPRCTDLPSTQAAATVAATSISVRGEHVSRDAHERWQAAVCARTAELDDACTFPVYELLTQLTAALQSESAEQELASTADSTSASAPDGAAAPTPQRPYHALLTSHHLVSPSKRRSMHQWASQLGLDGFAKVGYPGVVYAEGPQDAVETFVRNVKAMQWLALRVRCVEPVSDGPTGAPRGERWVELSKIGEVLERMRARGREALVTDLGIGAPSKDTKR